MAGTNSTIYPRVLLVEGEEDKRVIPELIEKNGIIWEQNKKTPIVKIRAYDGYNNLAQPKVISTELKGNGLSALGIIIDADDSPIDRWQSIRTACLKSIPNIPETLPEDGLIHPTPDGIKFGIWIMPDNKMQGMLETFLAYLIDEGSQEIWQFAQNATMEAKVQGAVFQDTHSDKANIYTWLAWQNPPGRQLHQAVIEHILNPNHANAQKFVAWFKNLYDLS